MSLSVEVIRGVLIEEFSKKSSCSTLSPNSFMRTSLNNLNIEKMDLTDEEKEFLKKLKKAISEIGVIPSFIHGDVEFMDVSELNKWLCGKNKIDENYPKPHIYLDDYKGSLFSGKSKHIFENDILNPKKDKPFEKKIDEFCSCIEGVVFPECKECGDLSSNRENKITSSSDCKHGHHHVCSYCGMKIKTKR